MIQANELRIGNWVSYKPKTEELINPLLLVDEIYSREVYASNNEIMGWTFKIEEVQPIPLSPEILEKCGFVKTALGYDSATNFNIYCHPKHQNHFYPCYKENMASSNLIKYLHQLQNLYFALTGEELIFKQ